MEPIIAISQLLIFEIKYLKCLDPRLIHHSLFSLMDIFMLIRTLQVSRYSPRGFVEQYFAYIIDVRRISHHLAPLPSIVGAIGSQVFAPCFVGLPYKAYSK